MEPITFLIVVAAGLVAGGFGTLVGGGSLLTIPVLVLVGLPPHIAIGTNRLGVVGINTAGWYGFHGKKLIDYKIGYIIAIPALIGAIFGAQLVLTISPRLIQLFIGIVTLILLGFVMYKPHVGIKNRKKKLEGHHYWQAIFWSFLIGGYGGFYGAGAGTFYSYVLIVFFGQTFIESAATRKVANFFASAVASIVFILNGAVYYYYAIALFIGAASGSYLGAHFSEKIGNVWMKRMFFIVVLIMAIKLLIP